VFDREGGKQFDYVFNCGGETRFSQEEKVYELRSYGLSMTLGKEAAKRNIKCFTELSTGMVYKSDNTPRKETDKLKPWSNLAKWKLKAEEDLAKIEGLNLVVMRMAHVYGPYTSKFERSGTVQNGRVNNPHHESPPSSTLSIMATHVSPSFPFTPLYLKFGHP
jgi:nucleoside-diphosphate-sugar epimerase